MIYQSDTLVHSHLPELTLNDLHTAVSAVCMHVCSVHIRVASTTKHVV
jgi:hypothetical protein